MSEVEDQADKIIELNELSDDTTTRSEIISLLQSNTNKATRDNFLKQIQKKDPELFNALKILSDDLFTVEKIARIFTRPQIVNPTQIDNPLVSQDPILQPDFYDDFIGFAAVNAKGTLNWTATSSGAGTAAFAFSSPGHPGIIELITPAAINGQERIHLGVGAADQPLWFDDFSRFVWIFNNSDLFSVSYRLGAISNFLQASAAIQDGFYFEAVSTAVAIGNWFAKTVVGGVHNDIDTGIALTANNWVKFECIKRLDGGLDWYINNVLVASHAPGAVTSSSFNFGAAVQASIAVAKTMYLDFVRLTLQDFSVLYPDALEAGNRHT